MKMIKIKNSTRFKVKSSPTYIINILARDGIKVKNISKEGNYVFFSVSDLDLKATLNILKGFNREFNVLEKVGFNNYFNKMMLRFGLWITVFCLIIAISLYSFFTLNYQVNGLVYLDEGEIQQILNKNAIQFPVVKNNLDLEKIKIEILNLDGISNCDVRLNGNLIEINVLEELPSPSIFDISKPIEMISSHDAIISRIIVLNGTALCKKGEAVRKGDALIAPYYIINEEEEIHTPVRANGYVYGRVWYTKSYIFDDIYVTQERTGKKERLVSYYFPGLKIEKDTSFDLYETNIIESNIYNILPFKVKQIEYYELKEVSHDFDFEANKESILNSAYEEMDNIIDEKSDIIRKWYTVKTLDKSTVLDIYYEVEQIISVYN